ncbi:hypothetical protein V6N12_071678 [Hibiscus sabdariffa]|uniref:Helicase protein MOM1 n=1 Tax=Hibiscus sabdariffa TaxID=183260 RepID=A0ABR2FL77_9ROSI
MVLAEVSGGRISKSSRETLAKKNTTSPRSSSAQKLELLEKQTANLYSMTPPAKRKTERLEKKGKNANPLRRSERGEMSSSSSSGSMRSEKSPDVLNTKRKKDEKKKRVKHLTMQTVEVNKIEQAEETRKKRRDARSYRALFTKPKKVDGTDRRDDLNGADSGKGVEKVLEEFSERTHERTAMRSTSQFAEETLKINNEHKLFPTSQKNSSKDMASNGGDPQISQNGLVAGEMNDDAETAMLKNLQSPKLVNSIAPGGVLDCDISVEMVPKVMPSERKSHDIDIDSAASAKMSSNDIGTCTEAGTSLSSGCKRKGCTETRGMRSRRQRVDCNSTKDICSSNMKLNQIFGSFDVKDRGKLDAGISTGHIEKPCNHTQQHMPSADLQTQTGSGQSTCIICRLDGKLVETLDNSGSDMSSVDAVMEKDAKEATIFRVLNLPLRSFLLELEGMEAIWDSRELEASEDGLQRQKQYFVKYEGLAHVHNRWVPENQVLLEAPSLIAKYNRKSQGAVWKQQWAVPHRLLQKRLLTSPKECDEHHSKEHDVDKLICHVEWLVKWCGLGYEQASWELENASFFSCPEGQRLIQEYETRKKAQRASKFDKERAVASLKISHLPTAVSSELDANLDAVNKLCNHLRRGQNAIIFYDHERISNVISSILAFSSEISSPFLIICSSASQYSWDEEFLHLAPSVDVVVYSGSKEIRNSIRKLEFYDEGSCIMFQVLITSPEVISEDLNLLDCIGWEAIIVDECQCPRIGSCFEQVKMITAGVRLLIISRQLKGNVAEYLNLLSLLDSQGDSNGSELTNSSDNINTLKERLAKYVAYECKLDSSRFLEYWVPALLSNVQLEKYCFTLVSSPLSLCSPSKTGPVGGLRTILVTSRKCCDHPYDVDQSLQMLLTKGLHEVEFLEVGIKASGKLQLLDAMLWEIKKRELKVVILFQYIGGSGRDLMGDILDEFLHQRFGIDCYEHVDNGVIPSKKQSALNRFNNERERFVFLLETRACLPSIKLSSVGTVIIFGSDWSPVNDLRALQRITFDSQFEQIKVFRLYSSFTVEEKLLMLSKQDKTIDSNIANISPSASHMLLKWGASYLFSQLENFHGITKLDASTLSQQSHLKDVIQEFLTLLHQTGTDDTSKLTLILQAKQNQGTYRTEMPLFGELKIQMMNEDPPHTFWTKLLEGKCPRWKYSTSTSLRNQKRVQYFDEVPKRPDAESAEVGKKRKKFISDGSDHPSPKAVLQDGKLATGDREGSPRTSAYDFTTFSRTIASGSDKIHASSTSLHQANNISKIPALKIVEWERRKQCDSQKDLHVLLRPQIAKLCEVLHLTEDVKAMVERFLEYFMNNHLVHREPATILQAFQISLCWIAAALLKQKLDHKESLALAKQHLGYLKVQSSPKASGLSSKAIEKDYSNATPYQQNIKAKIEVLSGFREGSDIHTILESGVAPEIQLAQRDLLKSVKEIQKKRDKLLKKQIEKHKQEMEQFNQKYEEEKAQLENKKRTEAAVIRLHSNVSTRTEKLNNLGTEYARKFDELEKKMDTHLKNLEASHVAARSNILESRTRWVESVKSWARVELLRSSLCEVNLSEARSSGIFQSSSGSEVRPSKIVRFVDDEAMTYSDPINKARPFKDNSERAPVECNLTANSGAIEEQAVSRDSCLREQDSVDEIPNGGVLVDNPVTISSGDVTENVISMRCSDKDQFSDGSKADMSDRENVSLTDPLENLVSTEASSSEKISDITTLRKVDWEIPSRESRTIFSSEGRENIVSLEESSFVEIPDESNLSKVDGPDLLREPVVANSGKARENRVSAEALSSEEIPNGAALNNCDGEVHLGAPKTVSSGEGYESLPSLLVPSSEEVPGGTTSNTADRERLLSRPEAICSAEDQGNIISANRSFEKQIPGEATLNVPDEETSKSISEIATSCDGMDNTICTKSSASKEQMHDTAACSMHAKEVSLAELGTAPSEVLEGGSGQRENDGTSPNENDQQDGVLCTMSRESALREPSSDLVTTNAISLPDASSDVHAGCFANLSKVDGPVPLREPMVANSGAGLENLVSAEALSSEEIPNGAALNNCDGEVHLGAPKTVSSGEGYESLPSLLVPSSEEVPAGTTSNTADRELPLSRPEDICSTEDQRNIMSANHSFEKQIPGETTLNVPNEEAPKSIFEIATFCYGMDIIICTKSSASKEQIHDTAACSMHAKEVSLAEPETAPSEVLEGGSGQRENDGTSPNENDQQDGVLCTMSRESALREPSSDLVTTNANSLPDASSDVHAGCFANLSKVDGPVPLREPMVANSGAGLENLVSAEALSSEEIPNGAALNNFDGEVHLGATKTLSSREGYESLPSLLVPSSEEVPGGTTSNTADRELPLSRPETICSTEDQGNIISANCSFEKLISGEAALNVPDEETPKSISEFATSCDGMHDTAACSMHAKEVSLAEPETAPSEVLEGGSGQRENDGTSPNENAQQDGVLCTMSRESALQEPSSDLVTANANSLPDASSEVHAGCFVNLSKVDGPVPLREPVVANSGACPENLVSAEALSSEEIPNGAALNNFDGEVHLGATKNLSSTEGCESLPSLLVPSSDEVPGGTTSNTADRVLLLSRPEAICSTEDQGNIMCANRSFEKQIPGEATLNVPDEETSKSISEIATSCDGMDTTICTKSSASKEQMHDTAACSMHAKEESLAEPETAPSEVLEGGSGQRENDGTSPNENEQQDGELCTMSRESALRESSSDLVTANANSLPDASSEVHAGCFANLIKVDGPVPLREPVVANSGAGPENLVSAEALSSEEIPNGAALNNFDGEVHLGATNTLSSREGYESFPSLLVPSSEEVPCGTTSNTADRELLLSRPEVICSTEDQGNIMSANHSFEKQIPGEATFNVPDEETPKSISEIATSCDGMDNTICTKSSASKEQMHDTAACSMHAKEVSLAEPETAPSEVLQGGSGQRENDGTSPNEIDQQDGVLCTMSRESALRKPPSDLVTANADSLPYASSEVNAGCFANNEIQNASQAAETSPINGAIDVTCNVSYSDVTVVELRKEMQQLRSFDLPAVSAVEHQSNSEGQTAIQSSQVQRQPVANHIELSNQDVLQPLDSPIDGVIDGLVSQASETRTSPVAFVSNGLPLWTAPAVSSRTPMISRDDPLQNEMKRIMKEKEQITKIHEVTKLQLKLECDKEIGKVVAQIRRQYDVKIKEKEAEFLLHKVELDVNHSKVLLNKNLAEAFRSICMDNRASGSAGAHQEANSRFLQQRFQLSSQQMVQQPSAASGFPSTGSVSRMQTVSPAVVNSQTMGSPLQVVNPSALFSGTPTRPPRISTISSSTVNPQMATEIRAPAPHLQPFRPSSSISPSSLPLHSGGMSSQQSQRNHPAASLSLCQSYVNSLGHRQASTTGQSGRNQHEIAGGFTAPPNSRSPSLNVLKGVIDQSGASANPPAFLLPDCSSRLATRFHQESHVPSSRSYSSQPSRGATDIVCLSDDD